MANFEAFRWNFSSSTIPEIGRSDIQANSFFVFYSPIKYYWIYNFDWAGKIIVFVIVLCCHVRLSFGKFAPIKKLFFDC